METFSLTRSIILSTEEIYLNTMAFLAKYDSTAVGYFATKWLGYDRKLIN